RLLHLGCVEFLAHQRNHPGAVLCRHHRLPARPHDRRLGQVRHPRHFGKLKEIVMAYLKLDHIDKVFTRGAATTEVLKDINLTIEKGEYVSIIGHSGCGKSTLLNIIAGLTVATTGGVLLENREVNSPGPDRAVVFQNHSLLPWLTVYENVRLDGDEAVLLSDRIVMMTNGPSARIGEVLEVPLARPRKRLELATNATYLKCRQRVLEFLYERHRFVEAA